MSLDILLVLARHSISGVPLAQIRLARALAERGHRVTLLYGTLAGHTAPVIPGVAVEEIGADKVRGMFWPLIQRLRTNDPELIFTAEDHLTAVTLLAAILSASKARISGSSRVPPDQTYSRRPLTKRWLLKILMKRVMWRANALTCVSKGMVEQYHAIFPEKIHAYAYNIIGDAASRTKAAEPVDDDDWFAASGPPVITAAGTLHERKGFHDLIPALGLLRKRGHEARLVIFGEGPQREELRLLAIDHAVDDLVRMPGAVENPLKYFARSEVFALTSYAEGMPNVLVEAMMCGATPVATDCLTGPRELLGGGRSGYLVPVGDVAGIADALEAALDRRIDRRHLDEAIEPFREEAVIARHFDLLGLDPSKA